MLVIFHYILNEFAKPFFCFRGIFHHSLVEIISITRCQDKKHLWLYGLQISFQPIHEKTVKFLGFIKPINLLFRTIKYIPVLFALVNHARYRTLHVLLANRWPIYKFQIPIAIKVFLMDKRKSWVMSWSMARA